MRDITFARVWPVLLLALACRSSDGEKGEPEAPVEAAAPPVSAEIVERLAADALERGVVGLAVGVAIGGEVVYAEGFGHADLERTRPVSAETIFDAASVGKQFTAAAILKLVEDGRIDLDEPIRTYVADAPSNFPDATVFQLLTHTSGFVDGDLDEQNPPETWSEFRSGPVLLDDPSLTGGVAGFRAGETWCYANTNYLLLGLAVDAAAGAPYHEYVADELLDPLDMGMLVCAEAEGELASGSFTIDDGEAHEVAFVHLSNYGGGGSIRSSVLGLLEWQRALDDGRILEPASLNTMRSPAPVQGETDSALIPYGTGIRLGTLGTHAKFGHTGTFDGGTAVLARYPDADLTIAVLSNTNRGAAPHALEIEARLARILLDEPLPDGPLISQPIPPDAIPTMVGRYCRKSCYDASIENGELVARSNGQVVERLAHVGDLLFRQVDSPGREEWFLADGDWAGWWLLERDGFLWDVLRRE